ncbi:MAG: hypothetical protein FWC15_07400 [Fibromonadales bacterium]|nr:hypothetical protein [Fibromonadales bacterium]
MAIALILMLAFPLAAQVSAPFKVNFENHPAGPYTTAMAKQDFPQPQGQTGYWYYGMDQGRAEIADEGGNKVLRAKYPAGCVGTNDQANYEGCAIQIKWRLPEVAKEMWASYKVKFEDDFEFVKGGKLPGLCGGQCYTGGNTPQQGDGWSARIMWRTGGSIVQYMYFADQAINYGDDMKWDYAGAQKTFQTGVWYNVATQIVLNTVSDSDGAGLGHKNGIVRSWLDNELSLSVDTLRLVDFEDQRIDLFYISTFHGGSDQTWAPSKDVYVRYDDFRISVTKPEYLDNTPVLIPENSSAKKMNVRFEAGVLHFSQALQEQSDFKLMNLKGSVVWQGVLAPGQTSVKLPALSPGVYIWQLNGKTSSISLRLGIVL